MKRNSKPARYLTFVLTLVAFGLLGAFASRVMSSTKDTMRIGAAAFLRTIQIHSLAVILFIIVLVSFLFLFFYRRVKHLSRNPEENENALERAVVFAQGSAAAGEILQFILIGIFVTDDLKHNLLAILLTFVGIMVFVFMEITIINMQKRIFPHKGGDPLKFSFDKDWIAGCDEAEKLVAYIAAFRSFLLLKRAFAILMAATLIGHLTWGSGMLPIFVTGILWLIHTISYLYYNLSLSAGRLPQ